VSEEGVQSLMSQNLLGIRLARLFFFWVERNDVSVSACQKIHCQAIVFNGLCRKTD